MVSFLVRKASTLAWSRCAASVSFSSSPWRVLVLRLQVGDLLLERGAARQRLPGQVLTAQRQRLAALVLQLGRLLLQLR